MKNLFNKKVLTVITVASLLTAIGSVVYADSAIKKISAFQNGNIAIEVDGQKINLSSEDGMLYPIVYQGRSYVPAKYVAESLGARVDWDNKRQVITIASGTGDNSAALPLKDGNSSTTGSNQPSSNSNKNASSSSTTTSKPSTSTSASVNAKSFYPKNTTAQTMFNDNKAAAKALIGLYAKALKSKDLTEVNAWLKANIQKDRYDNDAYDHSSSSFKDSIDDYRKYYEDEYISFADNALAALAANNLSSKSKVNMDEERTKWFEYYVEVSDKYVSPVTIGVDFLYSINEDTNQYYFSQVIFH
ncbi:hypothetical protein PAECIP111893_00484 [Paenibacillus plantiphilus]|uniref:Copper amine oxidase-like N-terminal domain-containing protein n=2 Tax=Paenibacillus plantiphilus TaxID=2905650 RepID=A0ABN8FVZ9_9BACL|nr:hypothetical protein PAECIP111893_00484 [Paenibacillus plantiphilus]